MLPTFGASAPPSSIAPSSAAAPGATTGTRKTESAEGRDGFDQELDRALPADAPVNREAEAPRRKKVGRRDEPDAREEQTTTDEQPTAVCVMPWQQPVAHEVPQGDIAAGEVGDTDVAPAETEVAGAGRECAGTGGDPDVIAEGQALAVDAPEAAATGAAVDSPDTHAQTPHAPSGGAPAAMTAADATSVSGADPQAPSEALHALPQHGGIDASKGHEDRQHRDGTTDHGNDGPDRQGDRAAMNASSTIAGSEDRQAGPQAAAIKQEVRQDATPTATGTTGAHSQPDPVSGIVPVASALATGTVDHVAASEPFADVPAEVPDPELPARLVQSLRMQALRGGGDAIVQIRPEHLGPVTVSLRVEHGSVSAHIIAADPKVVGWLQAHQDVLRDGLQANGLTLNRLVVDQDGRNADARDRQREAPRRPRYQPPDAPQSTFELTI